MDYLPYIFLALLEGLLTASVLALMAVGLSLTFGVLRIVNIAHGGFLMLGAIAAWFVTYTLAGVADFHPALMFVVALIVSVCAVAIIGLLADITVLRLVHYEPQATIVATIGLLYIFEQSVLSLYGADAHPVSPPFYFLVELPWFGYSGYKLAVIVASIAILSCVWFVLKHTHLGLALRASAYDKETAQNFGIPVARIYSLVFAASAGLAALAGVLIVPIRQAHYLMGGEVLLLSFIVVIIGGLGSLRGIIPAALFIGISDALVSLLVSPTLAKIVVTLLVVAVLICRPQGLFSAERTHHQSHHGRVK